MNTEDAEKQINMDDIFEKMSAEIQNFQVGEQAESLIKQITILEELFYRVSPAVVIEETEPLLRKFLELLEPSLVPYAEFSENRNNFVETLVVSKIFDLYLFFILNFNQVKSNVNDIKIDFRPLYKAFVNLFIENKISEEHVRGLTYRGQCVIFGGKLLDFIPSPAYFLTIATIIKQLIQFDIENFNKLVLIQNELLFIANSTSLNEKLDVNTDVLKELLEGNENIGYSILQTLSYIDKMNIQQTDDNQNLLKFSYIIQNLERKLFVEIFIDEARQSLERTANTLVEITDNVFNISKIEFDNGLDPFITQLKRYLNFWAQHENVESQEVPSYFLSHYENLPSKQIKLLILQTKRRSDEELLSLVQQLVDYCKDESALTLTIAKALGQCGFLCLKPDEFAYLSLKLAFSKAADRDLEECVSSHFNQCNFLQSDLLVLNNIKDLRFTSIANTQINYYLDESVANYNKLRNLSNFDLIYENLRDKRVFLDQFLQQPDLELFENLTSIRQNASYAEIKVLKQIFAKTHDIEYLLDVIMQNPAHLENIEILNALSVEQVYSFLKRAEELQEFQLKEEQIQQKEFTRQRDEGVTYQEGINIQQIAQDLLRKISQTEQRITQLKKGNCGYFEGNLYWGKTELLTQRKAANYRQIMEFLLKVGYLRKEEVLL